VGEGTAQATRRQVELTRQALAEDVDRFARRLRAELDWKARLRRDGPQIVAIAGAVGLVLVGVLVLRHRHRAGRQQQEDLAVAATVEDIARELRALRDDVEKRLDGHGSGLLQKVAVAAAGSAATAGGKVAAGRLLDRVEAERPKTPAGSATS